MIEIDKEKLVNALLKLNIYSIECEPEHIPIKGNVLASGDDTEDYAAEQEVRRQLEAGNNWAWCTVGVIARYCELEVVTYLGACSYSSEEEFKAHSFDDMRYQVARELADSMIFVTQKLFALLEI